MCVKYIFLSKMFLISMQNLSMHWLILVSVMCVLHSTQGHDTTNNLLWVFSFDGFGHDYLKMANMRGIRTPNFDKLIKEGVIARNGMKPAFVTKTFPNHFSIATGMYEEDHGVVNNVFYDPQRQITVDLTVRSESSDTYWWNNGTSSNHSAHESPSVNKKNVEPIWITNEKSESHMKKRSGVMMWPGCEMEFDGYYPSRYEVYDPTFTIKQRIDKVLGWFTNDIAPINLALLYYEEPDETGHSYGIDNKEIIQVIGELDTIIGYVFKKLKDSDMLDKINLIFTSDHGMKTIDNYVVVDKYFSDVDREELLIEMIISSPAGLFYTKPDHEEDVYKKLQSIKNVVIYKKADIPKRYHYQFNARIPSILMLANSGYGLCQRNDTCEFLKGDHGYGSDDPDMMPYFIARGPAFRKNFSVDDLNCIDLYGLMCEVLDLNIPHGYVGSMSVVTSMLHEHRDDGEATTLTMTAVTFLLTVLFCTLIAGICCVAICRNNRRTRRRFMNYSVPMINSNGIDSTLPLVSDDDEI